MVKKLLLVEDDPAMREELLQVFGTQRIETLGVGTGTEATHALEKEVFNAALIDIKLPDCSGVDLVLRVRSRQPQCYCILMTAYASLESAIQAFKNGALDYLLKPFNPSQALSAVLRGFAVNAQALQGQNRLAELQNERRILEEKIIELRKLNKIFVGREEHARELQREIDLLRQRLREMS